MVVGNNNKNILLSTSGRVNAQVNYIREISFEDAEILKERPFILKAYEKEIKNHQNYQNRMNGTNEQENKKVS